MSLLKYSELEKMDKRSLESKLNDLKMELAKANVAANKQTAKTKEIKKAISRILTFTKTHKVEVKNK
ncbi:hypothetical protein COU62_03675 [Candidatus Pacearchaeota archaeon CG10_big_fil_rev_8_21_14_0_10_35_219]|nr:hypothetical protein [Candidatus Pacearchaeota archaeon]OIO42315.1 MAG: hypothetical protein AUJ63_03500 [Candidatus Pacearchaeota archaeon CG1_02_35_32]PIO07451.1 MAG: hypothetical protein COU62_03675 [Candidatus Pacearchaeota archaeon CG10_big_fil_rev_8_21_14_0_10_35_219]PIY81257.1 MAG: hypothetical protein COY79_03170 [Candidatus Pacearchaeota archaeon CG_4_10_14_0_8_um_filter_35_169]PIZ80186.1 MAG: hypothetical protein COY00_01815 [Candidatus Pacearchaeota archaeon CG_4_10_14_0_2_um_filt